MGLFRPAWRTKNEKKSGDAIYSLEKIKDVKKLNKVILSAPLSSVRSGAIRRMNEIARKDVPLDANECLRTLLLLDVEDIRALDWYMNKLFLHLSDEDDFLKIVLDGKNQFIRSCAIYHIEKTEYLKKIIALPEIPVEIKVKAVGRIQDADLFEKIAADESLPAELRTAAIKRVNNQKLLSEIVWRKGDSKMRVAAMMKLTERDQLERIRKDADDSLLQQRTCERLGHRWDFVKYVPHGRDGKDALYVCEICGEQKREPYEWSTADSI